jgi:predicted N-acetyltransferase YhbS
MKPLCVKIRPMRLDDLAPAAHLIWLAHSVDQHPAPEYEESRVSGRLPHPEDTDYRGFVAERNNMIVGAGVIGRATFAKATWWLSLGATHPLCQREGIGHQLVLARLRYAIDHGAAVIIVSSKDRARWERYGFWAYAPQNKATGAWPMSAAAEDLRIGSPEAPCAA